MSFEDNINYLDEIGITMKFKDDLFNLKGAMISHDDSVTYFEEGSS